MINKEVITAFATPIYLSYIENPNFCKTYIEVLKKQREDGEGDKRPSSWKSEHNLMDYDEFKDLSKSIVDETQNVLDNYGMIRDSVEINNMWAQLSDENDYHPYHTHPNSFFSGLLYLNAPKGCSPTTFFNKELMYSDFIMPVSHYNSFNKTTYQVYPEVGKLIFFPSGLPHMVERPLNADYKGEERATIAFTIMVRGENKFPPYSVKL